MEKTSLLHSLSDPYGGNYRIRLILQVFMGVCPERLRLG